VHPRDKSQRYLVGAENGMFHGVVDGALSAPAPSWRPYALADLRLRMQRRGAVYRHAANGEVTFRKVADKEHVLQILVLPQYALIVVLAGTSLSQCARARCCHSC